RTRPAGEGRAPPIPGEFSRSRIVRASPALRSPQFRSIRLPAQRLVSHPVSGSLPLDHAPSVGAARTVFSTRRNRQLVLAFLASCRSKGTGLDPTAVIRCSRTIALASFTAFESATLATTTLLPDRRQGVRSPDQDRCTLRVKWLSMRGSDSNLF